jgi:hypothetical protein
MEILFSRNKEDNDGSISTQIVKFRVNGIDYA